MGESGAASRRKLVFTWDPVHVSDLKRWLFVTTSVILVFKIWLQSTCCLSCVLVFVRVNWSLCPALYLKVFLLLKWMFDSKQTRLDQFHIQFEKVWFVLVFEQFHIRVKGFDIMKTMHTPYPTIISKCQHICCLQFRGKMSSSSFGSSFPEVSIFGRAHWSQALLNVWCVKKKPLRPSWCIFIRLFDVLI